MNRTHAGGNQKHHQPKPKNPVNTASFLSKRSFWWVFTLCTTEIDLYNIFNYFCIITLDNNNNLFRYLRDVFTKAQKRPLEESDLYETLDEHKSAPICDNFSKLWEQQLSSGTKRPHLLKVINKAYGWKVLGFGFIFAIIETICRYMMRLTWSNWRLCGKKWLSQKYLLNQSNIRL